MKTENSSSVLIINDQALAEEIHAAGTRVITGESTGFPELPNPTIFIVVKIARNENRITHETLPANIYMEQIFDRCKYLIEHDGSRLHAVGFSIVAHSKKGEQGDKERSEEEIQALPDSMIHFTCLFTEGGKEYHYLDEILNQYEIKCHVAGLVSGKDEFGFSGWAPPQNTKFN